MTEAGDTYELPANDDEQKQHQVCKDEVDRDAMQVPLQLLVCDSTNNLKHCREQDGVLIAAFTCRVTQRDIQACEQEVRMDFQLFPQ